MSGNDQERWRRIDGILEPWWDPLRGDPRFERLLAIRRL